VGADGEPIFEVSILTRPEGRVQLQRCRLLRFRSAFQSSPVPKDGCNTDEQGGEKEANSFNPHPSRRTGATTTPRNQACRGSFQSSPVPKDGCNQCARRSAIAFLGFNPHPSRRTGATEPARPESAGNFVSILTRPEGRVQLHGQLLPANTLAGFNPHPSRRTGATLTWTHGDASLTVSILTRPEGRVQLVLLLAHLREQGFNPHPSRRTGATRCRSDRRCPVLHVSILTRPEGRVQRIRVHVATHAAKFQSSPVPKDGCNTRAATSAGGRGGFNPHPSRRTGATKRFGGFGAVAMRVSILTRPEGRVQRASSMSRCTLVLLVSILTRPEGRVQHGVPSGTPAASGFQSSPVPKDGCNSSADDCPPRRDGFQSSPVPKDGCNLLRERFPRERSPCFNPHPSRRTGATAPAWRNDAPA